MRTITLAAAALMCSASALAQTTETTTAPNTGATPDASVTTGASASITTADPSASTSTATGATAAAPATSASMPAQTSTGRAGIAAHDSDQDGSLTPLEFAEHVSARTGDASLTAEARRERFSRAPDNGAIKLLNRTADEFGAADRNRDRRVDATELAMWQSGGMSARVGATPSAPITSGAGTMSPAPDTSATMSPRDPAAPEMTPPDDMTDDLQNSTDSNESTTTPPTD